MGVVKYREDIIAFALMSSLHFTISSNSSNTDSFLRFAEGGSPQVGLSQENILNDLNRFSIYADALVGDVIGKCTCHSNKYSKNTHALCKSKCAKLARRHVLHAALSRQYFNDYIEHLNELTIAHEKESAERLVDLRHWYNLFTPVARELLSRSDILEFINSPDDHEWDMITELHTLQNTVVQSGDWNSKETISEDIDDDFLNVIQCLDGICESPINFFESIYGHLEMLSMRQHYDFMLEKNSGYSQYVDAVQLCKPHLRQDIMDYIRYCVVGSTAMGCWDEKLTLQDLIVEARTYFSCHKATNITARQRMGISDLEVQSGEDIFKAAINTAAKRFGKRIDAVSADPDGYPQLADFMENLALFYQEYVRCQSFTDFALCYYKFLKMQFGISLSRTSTAWIVTLVEEACEQVDAEPDLQSGCFAEFVQAYKSVTQSSIWEKMAKLSMLIGSLAMCWVTSETLSLKKFTDICTQVYQGMKATDMFGQVLETIQVIYAKCIPVLRGDAAFSSIWQGLGDGKQLDLDIVAFIGFANKYIEGTADEDTPDPEALLLRAVTILDKLTLILKATGDNTSRSHIRRTILQIESLRNNINIRFNNTGIRAKPYTLSLFGTTGVGKSCLSFEIAVMLQKALKIDAGSDYIFRLDEQDKYHSSLTNQHNVFVLDDLGNTRPECATIITTEPIIAFANNCPKFATMADVASKGVVAIKPKVLMITTNIKTLHAATYSVAPDAVLRRIESHITVKVKPQYADIDGQLATHVDPMALNYDCWLFTLQKFSPNTTHLYAEHGFEPVSDAEGTALIDVSFAVLCRHLVVDAQKHHVRQDAYVLQTKSAQDQPYCACGIRAIACDRCVRVQAGYINDGITSLNRVMGLREVYQYPIGRDLVNTTIMNMVYYLALLSATALTTCSLTATFAVLFSWLVALLAYVAHCVYRIITYKVKFEYANVCADVVKAYTIQLLGHKAKVVGALVSMAGLWMAYRKVQRITDPQGSLVSRPKVTFEVGKIPDTWKRPELSDLPKNPLTTTATGLQVSQMLSSKLCSLRVFTNTTHEYAATLPICTNFWIVPHHVIIKDYEKVKIIHTSDDVINYSATTYREGSYRRIGKTDFALLYMPGKGDQRDIIKYFPTASMFKDGHMRLVDKPCRLALLEQEVIEKEGRNALEPKRSVHGIRVTNSQVAPRGLDCTYWGGSYVSPVPTFRGMCGCPIVSESSAPYIVGMHSAGVTGSPIASYCTIMREDLEQCLAEMTKDTSAMYVGSETGDMKLGGENMEFKHALPERNHFAFMENAEVDIVGSHTGNVRRYTSMVQPTDYTDDVESEFGIERKHGKPALLNHWYPARLWAEACANAKPVEMKYLDEAYNSFYQKVIPFIKDNKEAQDGICVLDDVSNLSGVDGIRGLYKLNYAASAGIPYGKPKREYVKETSEPVEGISVAYELTDEMKADIEYLENTYKAGNRGYAPHRANRKDESIKLDKAKVRIFSGTNMPYLFLMRKYFLSISVFMQKYPEVFESAVGVNPYSKEWTRLFEHISKYGTKRMVAGDYEKFDQYVHSMLTYAAFKILIAIAELCGYDEEDLMVMRGLATDTCNPVYELDGLWIKYGGSSPSGHALTVVVNGLVNSFYVRIAFYKARDKYKGDKTLRFNDNVAFMSYGDDNVMSVSDRVTFFNHCTYQEALKDYGLNYTMADKTAQSVPFIGIADVTFLKRAWVWSDEFQKHMAPLEKDSIFKMLHSFVVSKVAPRQQQLADILRSANQEFFMHGVDQYEENKEKLMRIAQKHELSHFIPGGALPSLHDMKAWYVAME